MWLMMTGNCNSEKRGTGQKDRVYDVEATRRWVREYIDTFSPLGEYDEDVQMADICRENDLADLMCEVITQVLEVQPTCPRGGRILLLRSSCCSVMSKLWNHVTLLLLSTPTTLKLF